MKIWFKSPLVVLLAVFWSVACSALEDFNQLPVAVPGSYAAQSNLAVDSKRHDEKLLDSWWIVFGDARLDSLLDDALENNFSIKQAFSRLAQLQARYSSERSRLFPTFEVAARAERSQLDIRTFGDTSSNFQVSAPVSYEVDLFGRIRNESKSAFKKALASEYDLRTAAISVAAELVDAYYLTAEACEHLALVNQSIQSDSGFLRIVQQRYIDGLATPLDVYQAKLNLAANKARKPVFENSLAGVSHRISVLTGEYPDKIFSCEDFKLPRELVMVPAGIPAELINRRPDLKSALLQLEAADSRYAARVAERFPQIVLTASGGYANTEVDEVLRPDSLVWRLASDLSLTVIDFGGKSARADEAYYQVLELRDNYFELLLQAFKEVEDALVGEEKLRESIRLQEERVAANRGALRVSTEQYLQGITSFLDVLVAQAQYYQAQSDLLSTRRSLVTNHVQLVRALGGGWTIDQIYQSEDKGAEPNGLTS